MADETEILVTRGWERVGPMMVPLMIPNMASCQVSMHYGIKGPVVTNTAACAAGVYSLFEALHFLRRGDIGAAVTGGTESAILPLAFISMARTGALSRRNDDPQTASRPFDKDRDGFVFGEGAGMLMLETLEHAQSARRAHPGRAGRRQHHRRRLPRQRARAERRKRPARHRARRSRRRAAARRHRLRLRPRHRHAAERLDRDARRSSWRWASTRTGFR